MPLQLSAGVRDLNNPITVLIPCRAGSQRVPNKNTRPFAESSLLQLKLEQVSGIDTVDHIVVSTDDQIVVDICRNLSLPKVVIHERDPEFSGSETTTDELCEYFSSALEFETLLWTHVTSPFVDAATYEDAIDRYQVGLEDGYDSLVGVRKTQEFVWRSDLTSANYDIQTQGMWPRTQTIDPLYIVNSAAFIISHELMTKYQNRVGENPLLYEMSGLASFDVDWETDFTTAEKIWKNLYLR